MELQKVYINGKETGLVVEGFDIEEDAIYLKAHKKEYEFSEMMKYIGDPNFSKEKKYRNKIRQIFNRNTEGQGMIIHNIFFNFGFIALDIEHGTRFSYRDIAMILGIPSSSSFGYPQVLPIMNLDSDTYSERWIYVINCRDAYFKAKRGWPEAIPCNAQRDGVNK